MKVRKVSSMAMLSKEELNLIEKHMKTNPNIKFTDVFEGWYDENGDLCIQYGENIWYHYNVERGEWW